MSNVECPMMVSGSEEMSNFQCRMSNDGIAFGDFLYMEKTI